MSTPIQPGKQPTSREHNLRWPKPQVRGNGRRHLTEHLHRNTTTPQRGSLRHCAGTHMLSAGRCKGPRSGHDTPHSRPHPIMEAACAVHSATKRSTAAPVYPTRLSDPGCTTTAEPKLRKDPGTLVARHTPRTHGRPSHQGTPRHNLGRWILSAAASHTAMVCATRATPTQGNTALHAAATPCFANGVKPAGMHTLCQATHTHASMNRAKTHCARARSCIAGRRLHTRRPCARQVWRAWLPNRTAGPVAYVHPL